MCAFELVVSELESVYEDLRTSNDNNLPLYGRLVFFCENLKIFGRHMEDTHRGHLDKYLDLLRKECRNEQLPSLARYRFLEVIELRAMKWDTTESHARYYHRKFSSEHDVQNSQAGSVNKVSDVGSCLKKDGVPRQLKKDIKGMESSLSGWVYNSAQRRYIYQKPSDPQEESCSQIEDGHQKECNPLEGAQTSGERINSKQDCGLQLLSNAAEHLSYGRSNGEITEYTIGYKDHGNLQKQAILLNINKDKANTEGVSCQKSDVSKVDFSYKTDNKLEEEIPDDYKGLQERWTIRDDINCQHSKTTEETASSRDCIKLEENSRLQDVIEAADNIFSVEEENHQNEQRLKDYNILEEDSMHHMSAAEEQKEIKEDTSCQSGENTNRLIRCVDYSQTEAIITIQKGEEIQMADPSADENHFEKGEHFPKVQNIQNLNYQDHCGNQTENVQEYELFQDNNYSNGETIAHSVTHSCPESRSNLERNVYHGSHFESPNDLDGANDIVTSNNKLQAYMIPQRRNSHKNNRSTDPGCASSTLEINTTIDFPYAAVAGSQRDPSSGIMVKDISKVVYCRSNPHENEVTAAMDNISVEREFPSEESHSHRSASPNYCSQAEAKYILDHNANSKVNDGTTDIVNAPDITQEGYPSGNDQEVGECSNIHRITEHNCAEHENTDNCDSTHGYNFQAKNSVPKNDHAEQEDGNIQRKYCNSILSPISKQEPYVYKDGSQPRPELNEVHDSTLVLQYRYTLSVGEKDSIDIISTNVEVLRAVKSTLQDYFANNALYKTTEPRKKLGLDESGAFSLQSLSTDGCSLPEETDAHEGPVKVVEDILKTPPSCDQRAGSASSPMFDPETEDVSEIKSMPNDQNQIVSAENANIISERRGITHYEGVAPSPGRIKYNRDFFIELCQTGLSRRTPKNWSAIIRDYPIASVMVKRYDFISALLGAMGENVDLRIDETQSYLNENEFYSASEFYYRSKHRYYS